MVVIIGKRVHTVDNACRDGERCKGTSFETASGMEVEEPYEPWRLSVGMRQISCSLRDFVELRGKIFSCASAYAPNSFLQCFLNSTVVPVMIVHGEIVQDMPLFTGSVLSQKTAFSTMRDIILFEIFL